MVVDELVDDAHQLFRRVSSQFCLQRRQFSEVNTSPLRLALKEKCVNLLGDNVVSPCPREARHFCKESFYQQHNNSRPAKFCSLAWSKLVAIRGLSAVTSPTAPPKKKWVWTRCQWTRLIVWRKVSLARVRNGAMWIEITPPYFAMNKPGPNTLSGEACGGDKISRFLLCWHVSSPLEGVSFSLPGE